MRFSFRACVIVTASVFACGQARAAVNAADEAGNYATSGQPAWANGTNQGSGFQPWSGLNTNVTNFGFFTGSSAGNGTGGAGTNINSSNGLAWGLYANTSNLSEGVRPLTGTLDVNQTIRLFMDNGFINGGSSVGFSLRDSANNNVFEFFFQGGNANYTLVGSGSQSTTHAFTDTGMETNFTLTSATTFSFSVRFLNDNVTETFTGSLNGSLGAIDRIRIFNFNAGNGSNFDAYFNGFAVVPEPGTWAAGALLVGLAGYRLRRRK